LQPERCDLYAGAPMGDRIVLTAPKADEEQQPEERASFDD
jgi:hypothetical protein